MSISLFRNLRRAVHEQLIRGGSLTRMEIVSLKERLIRDPMDREARILLLGSQRVSDEELVEHARWFVEYEPGTSLGQVIPIVAGKNATVVDAWNRAIHRHHDDIRVIANAAWFFALAEPARALAIAAAYRTANAKEPEAWVLSAALAHFAVETGLEPTESRMRECLECAARAVLLGDGLTEETVRELFSTMAAHLGRLGHAELEDLADVGAASDAGERAARRGLAACISGEPQIALSWLRMACRESLGGPALTALTTYLARVEPSATREALLIRRDALEAARSQNEGRLGVEFPQSR